MVMDKADMRDLGTLVLVLVGCVALLLPVVSVFMGRW